MRVTSDKLTESEPRQQANKRIVEIQDNEYGELYGNDLLRKSLYILKHGLVSIGKLTYQTVCACSSAHG